MSTYIKRIRTESGDLQIDYNALANLPSNPNLLVNSDFRAPINQRGKTSYSNESDWKYCYCIDRWATIGGLNTNTVTVNSGSITITNNASDGMQFRQWFETDYDKCYYQSTYTATIKVRSISGTVKVQMNDNTFVGTLQSGLNVITANCAPLFFSLDIGAKCSVEIEYIKLEHGSVSTPLASRLYQEELLICRRYYRKYWTSMLFPQFYSNQYCGFLFDIPMRKDPTVKTFSILSTSNGSSIGVNVEVYAQGVYKFFTTEGYSEKAIIVPMLELDAEIY